MSRPFLALLIALLSLPTLARAADAPFADNVRPRGSLDNSRIKFATDKKGTVAFMGGSITEMNGYRPMVCDILKKRFPETQFTFIDAGVASTCSTTGAFRLTTDVFKSGPVDLFFVEFAVNDDQDAGHAHRECVRGMEGIIRHARQLNPNVDIVDTHFVNEGMIKTLHDGKTPLTVEAHEAVCDLYAVPSIHLASEVAAQIKAGTLTWKQYGGVHPAPFGNAIAARMTDELFNRMWGQPLAAGAALKPHKMPEPLDAMSYANGRFISPKDAKLINGFTLAIPDWKSLPGGKRDRFTKLPILSATEPGAQLSLDFEGTAIGAYVLAGPDAGIVEAAIDSGAPEKINLYHPFSKGLHYPRTVLFGHDLKPGKHTLTLKVVEETKSTGHAVRIMQFTAN